VLNTSFLGSATGGLPSGRTSSAIPLSGSICRSDMHDGFWGTGHAIADRTRVIYTGRFLRPACAAHAVAGSRRASEDFVLVALGNNGVNGVYQDGREAIVSAGRVRGLRHHPPL